MALQALFANKPMRSTLDTAAWACKLRMQPGAVQISCCAAALLGTHCRDSSTSDTASS